MKELIVLCVAFVVVESINFCWHIHAGKMGWAMIDAFNVMMFSGNIVWMAGMRR